MSLSAEALAQLEDLDLQKAREGLNFASGAEIRQPIGADLSDDELAGLRNWDLSGAMAKLAGLTLAEPPPAPMPEPKPKAATGAEEKLPDWLQPEGEEKPAALLSDEQRRWNDLSDDDKNAALNSWFEKWRDLGEEPADWQKDVLGQYNIWNGSGRPPAAVSGPTAEEAAAGMAAAEAAGAGTQVVSGGEVVIPPAREAETSAAVEAGVGRGIAKWLEKIDFGKLAREGARYLIPSLTGLTLGRLLPPEQALNLTQTAFAVGMLGFIGSGGCAVAERVVSGHPRVAGIARLLSAGRVMGAVFAETGMLMSAGSFAGGLWHEREIVRQAAAQMGPAEVTSGGGNIGADYYHGVSDVNLPQPPVEQPSAETVVPQLPQVPVNSGETQLQAAEAAQRAAEAQEVARQAALEAATRIVEVQPGDTLTGLLDAAGSTDPYGPDLTNTVLQSEGVLTGPQNPNRDMARALVEFIKAHPGGVNWRDAINGVGDLAKEKVGGVPLKDAIAQATRMIYPGQEMKVVVGAAGP